MNKSQLHRRHLIYASQFIDGLVEMRAQFLLCKGFLHAGWDVELLTVAQPGTFLPQSAWGSAPIRVVTGGSRLIRLIKLSLRLLFRPCSDIAITWVWDWHGYALALAHWMVGSPYAVLLDSYAHRASYHGTGFLTQLRLEMRYGFILRNADVILAETPTAYEAAKKYTNAHVILAPPGHWLSDLQAIEQSWQLAGRHTERRPVILYTGRLIESKNLHSLIAAFAEIADEFPEWVIEIIGPATDPAYALHIQQHVLHFGMQDRVRFLPAMTGGELFHKYRTSSIYCFPSQSEGFPSSILDAMYFGGAIVASNVGSIAYQLDDGRCGLLCPPGDLSCLTNGLVRLMESQAERQALMDSARQRCCEKFVWEAHFPEIIRSFESTLSTRVPSICGELVEE